MAAYARLLVLLTLRRLAEGLRGRTGVTLGILFIIAVLALLEASSGTPPPTPSGTDNVSGDPAGIAVLAAFAIVGGFGPYSTRLPHTPADIQWVHTAPISIRGVALVTLVHRCLLRSGVWLVAAALLAVVYAIQGLPLDRLPSTAASQTLFIAVLTSWSVGSASARGSRPLTVAALGIATLSGVTAALAGAAVVGIGADGPIVTASARLASHLGAALGGELTTPGLVALCAVGGVGVAFAAAATADTRERLVLDSAYWADLDLSAMFGSAKTIPSWRGGSGLTGPWALLWFEIAVLRHAGFNRIALAGTIVAAVVLVAFDPSLLAAVPLWYGLMIVIGMFVAGTSVHLRLGTLQAVPGVMSVRLAAIELPHLLHATTSMIIVLIAGAFAAGEPLTAALELMPSGLSMLAVALATRMLAVALAARREERPGPARLTTGLVAAVLAMFLVLGASTAVLQTILDPAASLLAAAWLTAALAAGVAARVLTTVMP